VNSFITWGFWEGRHWLPNAAMYRRNWELKPNGKVWIDLVKTQWWTSAFAILSNGNFSVRGFKGDYEVQVIAPTFTNHFTVQLHSNANLVLTNATRPILRSDRSNGRMDLLLEKLPGDRVLIEYSHDLSSWTPFFTNTSPTREFQTNVSTSEKMNFYRARTQH
jgi:hypothetical protein